METEKCCNCKHWFKYWGGLWGDCEIEKEICNEPEIINASPKLLELHGPLGHLCTWKDFCCSHFEPITLNQKEPRND